MVGYLLYGPLVWNNSYCGSLWKMITIEQLISAGFKEFKDSFSLADRFFQKRIWTPFGEETQYFINLYQYRFNDRESWELDLNFDRNDENFPYCWLKLRVAESATVDDIIAAAASAFEKNQGVNYGD